MKPRASLFVPATWSSHVLNGKGRSPSPAVQTGAVTPDATGADDGWAAAGAILSVAGTGIGAYHGYKRNNSVGWGIGWALLGGVFPVIVIPIAFAQGLGKRQGR